MSTTLGCASRAREIAKLFEAWPQGLDARDIRMVAAARRAIDAMAAGETPRTDDLAAIERYKPEQN
jgi:hypothetical protein